jgi:hypothetical protein
LNLLPDQDMTFEQLKEMCKTRLTLNSAAWLEQHQKSHIDLQVKILSYFTTKDSIYSLVPQLSVKSVHFIRKAYPRIEDNETFRIQHANERIKFQPVKSIEEHNSGIN